jgi:hypothetical protein
MKRGRMTNKIAARLDAVAHLKASITTFKELEKETGIRASYLRQLMSVKVRSISNKCDDSRGTETDSIAG